jgi:hypothetical protein
MLLIKKNLFFINSKSTFCTQKNSLDLQPDFEYEYEYTYTYNYTYNYKYNYKYNYDCIVLKNIKRARNKTLLKSLETPHDVSTLIDPSKNLKPKDV